MSKQTAVQWLVEQLARKHNEFQALTFYYDHKDEIEKAKQMEREQIMNDFSLGQNIASWDPEQYYNGVYGNQNSK
jgi:hypothetical protein